MLIHIFLGFSVYTTQRAMLFSTLESLQEPPFSSTQLLFPSGRRSRLSLILVAVMVLLSASKLMDRF